MERENRCGHNISIGLDGFCETCQLRHALASKDAELQALRSMEKDYQEAARILHGQDVPVTMVNQLANKARKVYSEIQAMREKLKDWEKKFEERGYAFQTAIEKSMARNAELEEALRSAREELAQKDKCAFNGPMRDCPTHGESEKLSALLAENGRMREAIQEAINFIGGKMGMDRAPIYRTLMNAKSPAAGAGGEGELSDAPCSRCGYNGPGYYQPETHKCVAAPAKEGEGLTDKMVQDSIRLGTGPDGRGGEGEDVQRFQDGRVVYKPGAIAEGPEHQKCRDAGFHVCQEFGIKPAPREERADG